MKTEKDKEEIIVLLTEIIRKHPLQNFEVSTPAVIDFVKNGQTYMKQGEDIYITIQLLRR